MHGTVGTIGNVCTPVVEHANIDESDPEAVMTYDPTHNFRAQAQQYACNKLQEVVREAFAKRTVDSGPRGPIILAAVEALPCDWTLFDALTDDERAPLRKFITQMEINFTADEIDHLIEENYPDR